VNALEREVEFYRREAATLRQRSEGPEEILGNSPAIRALRSRIAKAAPLDMPVLVTGESGTGKELVAHSLHRLSDRSDAPMVTVNAAALPASLVESELFGYEPGSFTGADRKGRKGKFEQADRGTIFLDEIGDMPMEVQAKLLRVVQDRRIERVGGARARQVDFRLISATNRDLETLVREGSFRLDLFYRISPIVIEVPPLAERREDIPLLVRKFLHDVAERHARPEPEISEGALELLACRDWPGNVRQLRHAVERAFVFAEGPITEECFLDDRAGHHDAMAPGFARPQVSAEPPAAATGAMRDQLGQLEKDLILEALRRLNGNKKRVAKELGISRSYLYKRLAELRI
jgi:transcriptional regulator with PAS, ATPase and Fis domain